MSDNNTPNKENTTIQMYESGMDKCLIRCVREEEEKENEEWQMLSIRHSAP